MEKWRNGEGGGGRGEGGRSENRIVNEGFPSEKSRMKGKTPRPEAMGRIAGGGRVIGIVWAGDAANHMRVDELIFGGGEGGRFLIELFTPHVRKGKKG